MFKDLIHQHDTSRELFLGLRYQIYEKKGRLGKLGAYPPGAAELTLAGGDRPEDIVLRQFELFDLHNRSFLRKSRTDKGEYTLESEALTSLKPKELEAIGKNRPVNFLFSPAAVLRAFSETSSGGEKSPPIDFSTPFSMYLSALSIAFEELRDLFGNLSYIGPLRDRPRRYYEIASEIPVSVGSRGEHTANLLRRKMGELGGELNTWVKRFEFGSSLNIKNISEELFSLSFDGGSPSRRTNIADAGFGASQVLPLIVQALTARKGSLTIAEQPEIHLNPRLQYLLADLFVEMAGKGRRVVVETHSEHLLLRLRRLVATGKAHHKMVGIYFVEKKDGASTARRLHLEPNGHIAAEVWPRGFFEDTLPESMALAVAQAKGHHKQEET
jgi:hypothetical protein